MYAEHWLYLATLDIRFPPDREAVRQELRDHIADKMDAYMARGYTEREAEYAAVADMGDPEAIAPELGRIHRPWWGYFWRASQVVLVLAAAFTLLGVLANRGGLPLGSRPDLPAKEDAYITQYGVEKIVTEKWRPKGSRKLSGYRFTAPLAWVERWTVEYEDLDGTTVHMEPCQLAVCLRSDTWKFWEPSSASQFMVLDNTVTDSRGNQYAYSTLDPHHWPLFCETWQEPFTTWYVVYLDIPEPENPPEWVEIPVGYGGDTLRVDLEKEAVS